MIEFITNIVALVENVIDIIIQTSTNIDSIKFETTVFADWMGYARYAMGDPLYVLFTTTILISLGVTLWTYLLKGIGMIKELLPWG